MQPYTIKNFLAFIAVILLAGCSTENWVMQKNGRTVSESEINIDSLRCEREAAATYPYIPASVSIPSGYSSGSTTNCFPVGNTIRCDTSGGITPAPQVLSYDGNSSKRKEFQEKCLVALGYQRVPVRSTDARKPNEYTNFSGQHKSISPQESANFQNDLGVKYLKGDGVPKDISKAIELFQKASAQGHAGAQFNLGLIYIKGDSVPKDSAKAIGLFHEAAAQGLANAQSILGSIYLRGEDTTKNSAKAIEWLEKAAAQGNRQALYILGFIFLKGRDAPRDTDKAINFLEKSAAEGEAKALHVLGLIYFRGEGVPKDFDKAIGWFEKSVASGNADSQSYLKFLLENRTQ
jgi:hypothetical protein